ncbi:MAG: methyltransferase [Bacteroidales bacterium]|nr:methyltransferase [Bacteroidales bacterium]
MNPMPVEQFHFKQFSLRQDRSPLKVGTDGVLLGAWVRVTEGETAIDIGAGCGVISLMLAQRGCSPVTALEIDSGAVEDTQENVANSPWDVQVLQADFAQWLPTRKYDLVISNPPFYNEHLRSPSASRAMARHGEGLTVTSLIRKAPQLLSSEGRLALVTPVNRREEVEMESALAGLSPTRLTQVITAPGKAPRRLLWEISVRPAPCVKETLLIGSEEYKSLVSSFYLKLS